MFFQLVGLLKRHQWRGGVGLLFFSQFSLLPQPPCLSLSEDTWDLAECGVRAIGLGVGATDSASMWPTSPRTKKKR